MLQRLDSSVSWPYLLWLSEKSQMAAEAGHSPDKFHNPKLHLPLPDKPVSRELTIPNTKTRKLTGTRNAPRYIFQSPARLVLGGESLQTAMMEDPTA